IFNSKVAKAHATADDPWALAWLKENTAGSGAYKIETFKPGEQVIMARNEAWNRGTADKSAFFKRVIVQSVPEPATRANLVERGAPLFGATWADGKPSSGAYPIPQPVKLDLDKAREYLKTAGMPDGFSTTFSFNVGQASTAEPMAALVKESLAKIGIMVDI